MPILALDQVPMWPVLGPKWGGALSSGVAALSAESLGIEVLPFSRENLLCSEHDGDNEKKYSCAHCED